MIHTAATTNELAATMALSKAPADRYFYVESSFVFDQDEIPVAWFDDRNDARRLRDYLNNLVAEIASEYQNIVDEKAEKEKEELRRMKVAEARGARSVECYACGFKFETKFKGPKPLCKRCIKS